MKSFLIQALLSWLADITAEQWKAALDWVLVAEKRVTTGGAAKRNWVLDKLLNLGVTGWTANLLVEAAHAFASKQNLLKQP